MFSQIAILLLCLVAPLSTSDRPAPPNKTDRAEVYLLTMEDAVAMHDEAIKELERFSSGKRTPLADGRSLGQTVKRVSALGAAIRNIQTAALRDIDFVCDFGSTNGPTTVTIPVGPPTVHDVVCSGEWVLTFIPAQWIGFTRHGPGAPSYVCEGFNPDGTRFEAGGGMIELDDDDFLSTVVIPYDIISETVLEIDRCTLSGRGGSFVGVRAGG